MRNARSESSTPSSRGGMKAFLALLAILTVAGAYAAGRLSHGIQAVDLAALEEFRATLRERDALIRSYRFNGFLRTLNEGNLPAAVDAIDSQPNWLGEDELRNFMLAWAAFDGRGAMDWALSQPGRAGERSAKAAMFAWAFHDPAAARKALESLGPAGSRPGMREQFGSGWISGPRSEGAADYVATLPAGSLRQELANVLIDEMMRQGPEAVIQWFESIPDDAPDDFKRVAFQKIARAVAGVDPVRASTWAEAHLGRDFAVRGPTLVGARWLEQDGPAALAWLTDLPPSKIRDDAVKTVLEKWLREDREEAEAWVLAGTPVQEMDPIVRIVVRDFSTLDGASAMTWAQRIYDSGLRTVVLIGVGSAWFHSDPEAAVAWMSENGISEEVRLEIVNSRPPPTPVAGPGSVARPDGARAASPRRVGRGGRLVQ